MFFFQIRTLVKENLEPFGKTGLDQIFKQNTMVGCSIVSSVDGTGSHPLCRRVTGDPILEVDVVLNFT